jgi:putative endopeptidase
MRLSITWLLTSDDRPLRPYAAVSRWIFAGFLAWAILATAAATERVRPRPGDDFFTYANWDWLERTPIPDDKPGVTVRSQMDDANDAAIANLLRAAAQSEPVRQPHTLRGKVGAFYGAYVDADRIEKLGDAPLRPAISAVAAAADRQAIARLMGRNSFGFEGSLFGLWMDVDSKHPERYAAYVGQQGLGLTTRDYYLDPSLAATREKYQRYIESLLNLAR